MYFNSEMMLLAKQTRRRGRSVAGEVISCKEDNCLKSGCVKLGYSENISE